ncbi:hypothetical protein D2C82_01015 [Helicobacter pylori]|nr:hypothetical protein [Helicobacter pylori]NHA90337.1 hypothetical protein [Helicobacter pylori]QEF23755.1 hypothetical protein D2C85_02700 [Helicobacter pylori]QEF27779.1 hypothetical protein D2C82_01015 [Helicobacter pylori]
MGGIILLPLPPYPFYPFTHRRYIPIKTIASVLILCKNYRYESLLLGNLNEKIDFSRIFNANAFSICKRSQNRVFRNFRHSWAAFFV